MTKYKLVFDDGRSIIIEAPSKERALEIYHTTKYKQGMTPFPKVTIAKRKKATRQNNNMVFKIPKLRF